MVREAVEQSGGELLVAEDPDPFGEGEIGGDDDDIVAAVDVVAGRQLSQLRFGDALQGLEVDLFERLVVGEAGPTQPALDGAGLPIPDLGLEQLPEVVLVVPLRVLGLTGSLFVVAQHGRHLERLEALLDDGSARGPAHDAAS